MADPLRHDCKLDMAEEILNFIANNSSSEAVVIRTMITDALELTEEDMEDAAEIVTDFSRMIKNQRY